MPSSSTSRGTSTPVRPPEEMAAVARLSTYHFAHQFKRATGLPYQSSSCAASSEPSSSCEQLRTFPWPRSRRVPASRTRASSAGTSSGSSASHRGGFGCTQESPNRPQSPPRLRTAAGLGFRQVRVACCSRFAGGDDRSDRPTRKGEVPSSTIIIILHSNKKEEQLWRASN